MLQTCRRQGSRASRRAEAGCGFIASRLEAIASRLEAIASRLEAIAGRLEAVAIGFQVPC